MIFSPTSYVLNEFGGSFMCSFSMIFSTHKDYLVLQSYVYFLKNSFLLTFGFHPMGDT